MSEQNLAGEPTHNRTLKRVRMMSWALVVVSAAVLAITLLTRPEGQQSQAPETIGGLPTVGGPFELTAHTGETVTPASFPNKHMLIFFGYTHCPDICPTTLADVTNALDSIAPEKAAKVQPLFVTVDPERDTPAFLRDYMSNFHPSMLGLTGTDAQLKQVTEAYRVFYSKATVEGQADEDYLVDHSTTVFLMEPGGGLAALFNHNDDGARIAATLEKLL